MNLAVLADVWTYRSLQSACAPSCGALSAEAGSALPLDGGVKCRHPERVEDARNRRMPRGENGLPKGERKK